MSIADAGPDGARDEGVDASGGRVVSGNAAGRGGASGARAGAGAATSGTSADPSAGTPRAGASGSSASGAGASGSSASAGSTAAGAGAPGAPPMSSVPSAPMGSAGAAGMSSVAGSGGAPPIAGAAGDKSAPAAAAAGAAGTEAMGTSGASGAAGAGASSDPVSVCGNGTVEAGEACDDGNTMPSDGCDASCKIERGGPMPGTGAGPGAGSACQNLDDLCDVCSCAQCGGRRGSGCSSLLLPARVNTCNAVTACVRQSACEIVNCYCGDDLVSCLSGEPSGPCRMQIEQAVGSTEITAIVAQLRDERSPIALAVQQVVCEQRQCAGVCQ